MDRVGLDRPNHGNDPARRYAAQTGRRVVFLLNPADDPGFRAAVEAAQREGAATPSEMQARLRAVAPGVVVRRRELEGEPMEVWYVYRDGHWIPAAEPR